jgi:hypothetical protein
MSETDTVRMVFRAYPREGGTIALMPDLEEARGLCMSFMHVGQHGAADYAGVVRQTRPATAAEVATLRRELEAPPYKYRVRPIRRWVRRRA